MEIEFEYITEVDLVVPLDIETKHFGLSSGFRGGHLNYCQIYCFLKGEIDALVIEEIRQQGSE